MTEPIDNSLPDKFTGPASKSRAAMLALSLAAMAEDRRKTESERKAREEALELRRLQAELYLTRTLHDEELRKNNGTCSKRSARFWKRFLAARDSLKAMGVSEGLEYHYPQGAGAGGNDGPKG